MTAARNKARHPAGLSGRNPDEFSLIPRSVPMRPAPAAKIDAIAVGHVTVDLYPDGPRPGGSVWYATQVWRAMGLSARMVTTIGPDFEFPFAVPATAGVSSRTTRFTNRHQGDATVQRVDAVADPVPAPAGLPRPRLLLLCPVLGEVDVAAWRDVPAGYRAAGLQGWLKRDAGERVVSGPGELDPAAFAGLDAACLSEEDLQGDAEWLARLRAEVPVVALTRGAQGCVVWHPGGQVSLPAHPARPVDPTGAGDTFAAVFAWHLAEGRSPVVAADLAAARAARAVEWVGPAPVSLLQAVAPATEAAVSP